MRGYRRNAVQKEQLGMATSVLSSRAIAAHGRSESDDDLILIDIRTRELMRLNGQSKRATVNPAMNEVLHDNRALAPLLLLAILVLFFFLSPSLPTGVREYIVAVLR